MQSNLACEVWYQEREEKIFSENLENQESDKQIWTMPRQIFPGERSLPCLFHCHEKTPVFFKI